jgi:hypothetical protein
LTTLDDGDRLSFIESFLGKTATWQQPDSDQSEKKESIQTSDMYAFHCFPQRLTVNGLRSWVSEDFYICFLLDIAAKAKF